MASTVASQVTRAIEALHALAELGEAIDDEWQYVADLRVVWTGRLSAVRDARGDAELPPGAAAAIDAAIDEAGLIEDPHRAIDWLSTFPQVVLLALGEAP